MPIHTFVTGGIRSGKSRYALSLANTLQEPRMFLATAVPFDKELKDRIAIHKHERESLGWETCEEPLHLECVCKSFSSGTVLLECVGMWLNNLMYDFEKNTKTCTELIALERAMVWIKMMDASPVSYVIISSEVGSGGVSPNPLARLFADCLGRINQTIASLAKHVVWCVSGIPVFIKK